MVRAGNKTNVIPGVAEFEIDGRTLPGQTDEDLLRELRAVLGPDVELEIIKSAPPIVTEPVESPVFDAIKREVDAREPDAVVVPYMIPGFTDAKYFTQMGARWYGFSPVKIETRLGHPVRRHVPRPRRARAGRRARVGRRGARRRRPQGQHRGLAARAAARRAAVTPRSRSSTRGRVLHQPVGRERRGSRFSFLTISRSTCV